MTSALVTSTDAPETDDSVRARILDAALVQFEKVGVKKTTIEDIARQAGVDRVTVYRRVGSRDDVVAAVYDREVARVLAELAAIPARHDNVADLVADIFVTVITLWRSHPLVTRMLALEPERVLPRLTTDGASTFATSIAVTEAVFRQAIRDGLLPETPDIQARAEIVCRIVHSLVLTRAGLVPLESDEELSAFARTYLMPIINP